MRQSLFRSFSETFLANREKEPYDAVSCNSWDSKRAGYEQIQQLKIYPESVSDYDIIQDILPHTAPRAIGTRNKIGNPYNPVNQRFFISRHALNGWSFQGHTDCSAASVASCINTALGFKRGDLAYVSTADVIDMMKLRVERAIVKFLEEYEEDVDLDGIKQGIFNLLHSEEQSVTEDFRKQPNSRQLINSIYSHCKDDRRIEGIDECEKFENLLLNLKKLRNVEVQVGTHKIHNLIEKSGFPLSIERKLSYTWEELKVWLLDPTVAIRVHIPGHACILFALAEDEESGKHRHLLIGSACGGQNPCSWIPFSEEDAYSNESYWINLSGLKLIMKSPSSSLEIKIVKRTGNPTEMVYTPPKYAKFVRPWYLKSKELYCNSCTIHGDPTDAVQFPLNRARWFNSEVLFTEGNMLCRTSVFGLRFVFWQTTLKFSHKQVYDGQLENNAAEIHRDDDLQKKFLKQFEEKYNLQTKDDWERVDIKLFRKEGGSQVLKYYKSFREMMHALMPELNFNKLKSGNKKKWETIEDQRACIELIREELGLKNITDWKAHLRLQQIKDKGGAAILSKYANKKTFLAAIYPEINWDEVSEGADPRNPAKVRKDYGFWKVKENQIEFMNNLAKKLNIKKPEEWYDVKVTDIKKHGGRGLFRMYSTYYELLTSLYPSIQWRVEKFPQLPANYWRDTVNQRKFMDSLVEALQIDKNNPNDWKKIKLKHIKKHGGRGLLSYYPTLYVLIKTLFPEVKGLNIFTARAQVSYNFWEDPKNHRVYLDYLRQEFGIEKKEDWKKVKVLDIIKHGGSRLFRKYSSLFEILKVNYPEYDWEEKSDRLYAPHGYWQNKENHRKFLDSIKEKYEIKTADDWHKISTTTIVAEGGRSLLGLYDNFFELLQNTYPEEEFSVFTSRKQVPRDYWGEEKNLIEFKQALIDKYNIQTMEDWYRISQDQIKSVGGRSLIRRYGIVGLLKIYFPEYKWDLKRLKETNKRSVQRWIFSELRKILPNAEIVEEFLHERLTRESGSNMEFDIFIPEYNIAIEYHGEHHYFDCPSFGPVEMYQNRDLEKEALTQKFGVHLIVISSQQSTTENEIKESLYNQLRPLFASLNIPVVIGQ